jgi:hypothetical protein
VKTAPGSSGIVLRDELRSSGNAFISDLRSDLHASNLQLLAAESPFAGRFKANESLSFVEFDICHSLPVTAQPAHGTGNVTGFHPQTLALSYEDLLYQQVNLEHLVKHHDPDNITHDRIIGCIVATAFPPTPEAGWQIPSTKEEAPSIHCCAAVFKIAQGAREMLTEHVSQRRKWSVSIEVMGRSMETMGLYRPSTKELFPLFDAPDMWFDALAKNEQKRLCVGKLKTGEQLALVYGGTGHGVIFQGVGFTATPASLEAAITAVQLSRETAKADIVRLPEGVCALQMSSVNTALISSVIAKKYPGAELLSLIQEGEACLPGARWKMVASATDPVAQIKLRRGALILKRMSDLACG